MFYRYLIPIFTHYGRPVTDFCRCCPNWCIPFCNKCKPHDAEVYNLQFNCCSYLLLLQQTGYCVDITNPNSLGPALVHISENFRLANLCILNGGTTCFFLMHIKIAMDVINMGFGLVRVHSIQLNPQMECVVLIRANDTSGRSFTVLVYLDFESSNLIGQFKLDSTYLVPCLPAPSDLHLSQPCCFSCDSPRPQSLMYLHCDLYVHVAGSILCTYIRCTCDAHTCD